VSRPPEQLAGIRPRHSWGQNFLIDAEIRSRIVDCARIEADDVVLEIGAGPGVLTPLLCQRAARVIAVEIDPRLAARLRAQAPGAEVLIQDVLELDLSQLFPEGGEIVVGNIPYYLTGFLVRRLLDQKPGPRRLCLLVQREVARRWCGLDGWSLSTLAVQLQARCRIEFEVPPSAFWPVPQVDSALVVMDVLQAPAIELVDPQVLLRRAEAIFQHRRKQLRGALARALGLSAEETTAILERSELDPSRRAESLSLAEWGRLDHQIGARLKSSEADPPAVARPARRA